jgi:hypothetical protein
VVTGGSGRGAVLTGGATLSGAAVVADVVRADHHAWRPAGTGATAGEGRGLRRPTATVAAWIRRQKGGGHLVLTG